MDVCRDVRDLLLTQPAVERRHRAHALRHALDDERVGGLRRVERRGRRFRSTRRPRGYGSRRIRRSRTRSPRPRHSRSPKRPCSFARSSSPPPPLPCSRPTRYPPTANAKARSRATSTSAPSAACTDHSVVDFAGIGIPRSSKVATPALPRRVCMHVPEEQRLCRGEQEHERQRDPGQGVVLATAARTSGGERRRVPGRARSRTRACRPTNVVQTWTHASFSL